MAIERFEQLDVWKAAHKLVLDVYRITQKFPTEESTDCFADAPRSRLSSRQ